MVFDIWFYENLEKYRKKANFEIYENTVKNHEKNHEVPENHQNTTKKNNFCQKSTNFQLLTIQIGKEKNKGGFQLEHWILLELIA